MQKPLRINYQSSRTPVIVALVLFFTGCAALMLLHIQFLYLCIFLGLMAILTLWNISRLYRSSAVIAYDGEFWRIFEDQQAFTVDLMPESFVSSYFQVLVFKAQAENKWFRLYFSSDNCNQADYRALCRLSLHR